ncbi:centromere protein S-like [Acipenser ruthenus]|uniref:centromere protein S-like n=1 Tax=Acipenser ruthenus TaxID=7906 RepID=UPI00145B880D|nr:centromere protein S-like [Acipenser ruthenus]XP_034760628.1 centromere protein S-like [Acipenser ruthenus]
MADTEEQRNFTQTQRLKAAVHYTTGLFCQEVAEHKEVEFSKQTIAAIAETTFRQCEIFARDLEAFARHAKRTTVNAEDVKLTARRSNALFSFITQRSEELVSNNQEQKEKRKKAGGKAKKKSDAPLQSGMDEDEDSNMA